MGPHKMQRFHSCFIAQAPVWEIASIVLAWNGWVFRLFGKPYIFFPDPPSHVNHTRSHVPTLFAAVHSFIIS